MINKGKKLLNPLGQLPPLSPQAKLMYSGRPELRVQNVQHSRQASREQFWIVSSLLRSLRVKLILQRQCFAWCFLCLQVPSYPGQTFGAVLPR